MSDWLDDLKRTARNRNCQLRDCGNGHWQIKGDVLVNYWPQSRNQTAVDADGHSHQGVSPEKAVDLAARPKPNVLDVKRPADPNAVAPWIEKFGRDLIVSAVQGAAVELTADQSDDVAKSAIAIRDDIFGRLGITQP